MTVTGAGEPASTVEPAADALVDGVDIDGVDIDGAGSTGLTWATTTTRVGRRGRRPATTRTM